MKNDNKTKSKTNSNFCIQTKAMTNEKCLTCKLYVTNSNKIQT